MSSEGLQSDTRTNYKPSHHNVIHSPDPITGISGTPLDGRSLDLPSNYLLDTKMPGGDDDYGDGVSSMNTSNHRGEHEINEIKIVGLSPTHDASITDHSSPVASEDLEIIQNHKSTRCIPLWIRRAPYWLRLIFICSLALLVAAAVFVGLGVGLSNKESSDVSQNVRSPTSQNNPTADLEFWGKPATDTLTSDPIDWSQSIPETPPSLPPTKAPTAATIVLQTNSPTETQDPEVFTFIFYVAGGRLSDDERALVPERLKKLPKNMGASFLLHIGDWNSPSRGCEEQSYQDVNTLFSTSSVPVYMVPGDNEYNGKLNKSQRCLVDDTLLNSHAIFPSDTDCEFPDTAFSYWREYLLNYETRYWDPSPLRSVSRQAPDHAENFSFFSNEIIFVGINMVGGTVHDNQEWAQRHAANLEWVESAYNTYGAEARVMVVFAHAAPGRWKNDGFYNPFFLMVEQEFSGLRVVLIHRNLIIQTAGFNEDYVNIPNLDVVVAEGMSTHY